jgi:hypothetical protein
VSTETYLQQESFKIYLNLTEQGQHQVRVSLDSPENSVFLSAGGCKHNFAANVNVISVSSTEALKTKSIIVSKYYTRTAKMWQG